MRIPTIEEIEKLRVEPRKKDREFWGLSRRDDQNGHNYNMYNTWLEMTVRYLKERAERKTKNK